MRIQNVRSDNGTLVMKWNLSIITQFNIVATMPPEETTAFRLFWKEKQ